MNFKNQGLTVGELTITIAILILLSFVWSGLNNKKGTEETSLEGVNVEHEILLAQYYGLN